ncbi:MAG: TMEM165/GDT1 family protein [Geobacteraceae bacterium]|nr:TMEM165/GDT1 family protein [Geobacteraceae bacterium]
MTATVFLTTFGVIFLAELGDKTQLTAMALAARYPWKKIFIGIALAFALLNLGAVLLGKAIFAIFPVFWTKLASSLLFLYFGVTTLVHSNPEKDGHTVTASDAIRTAFFMILFAELGDKTQLVTLSLAAQYNAPVVVFTASTLALWLVSLLGIFLGKQLLRLMPLHYIHRIAAVLFLLFGVVLLYQTLA